MVQRTYSRNGEVMSVCLEGGCRMCGRLCTSGIDGVTNEELTMLVCVSCWEEYYSPQAIRRQKLERVLHVPWYKRIFGEKEE